MSAAASSQPHAASHAHVTSAQRIEELGRIIMAYSEVTERLQQSHDQLKQQVENLRRELGEKNRLLERSNRLAALGEMAAGLAHEIRNPLGAIKGAAQLLVDADGKPVPVQDGTEFLAIIVEEVNRLNRVVTQFLDYARPYRATPPRSTSTRWCGAPCSSSRASTRGAA